MLESKFLSSCCVMFVLAAMLSVSADTLTWTGGAGDFLWSSAANWSSDGTHAVPQNGDSVTMTLSGGTDVKNDIQGLSLNTLSITTPDKSGSVYFRGEQITITGGVAVSIGRELQWFTPLVWSVAEGGEFSFSGLHLWFMNGFKLSGSSDFIMNGGGALNMNCDNSGFTGRMILESVNCTVLNPASLGSGSFDFDSVSQTYKMTFNFTGEVNIPVTLRNGNSDCFRIGSGKTVTFNDKVQCIGDVRINSYGITYFRGGLLADKKSVVLNGSIYIDGEDDMTDGAGLRMYCDAGTLHLGAKVANTPGYMIAKATLKMIREDCFYEKQYVNLGIGYSSPNFVEKFDLNGFDQTIGQLQSTVKEGVERIVMSETPATLTIKTANNTFNGHINGALSLVVDEANGKMFSLTGGVSDTTGSLTVNKGGFTVKGGVSLPNISKVNVGAEGTMKFESGDVNSVSLYLDVASGGVLELASGVTLSVVHAYAGSGYLDAGRYTKDDLPGVLAGDGTLVVLVDGPVEHEGDAVWTGETGLSLETPGNWKGGVSPDLDSGTFTLMFSEGGDSAQAQRAVETWGLSFMTNAPFTLSAASADCTVGINQGGITVTNPVDGTAVEHVISAPLVIDATPQKWSVAAGQTLNAAGAVSGAYMGGIPLEISGMGTLKLSGDNSGLNVPLVFTNGVMVKILTDSGLGSPSNTAVFYGMLPVFRGFRTNHVAMALYGNSNGKYFGESSSQDRLVQKGAVTVCGSGPHIRFRNETFEGGMTLGVGLPTTSLGGWFQILADCYLHIKDKPLKVLVNNTIFDDRGILRLSVTGNEWTTVTLTKSTISCEAPNVLCPTGAVNFGWSGQVAAEGSFGNIELNGFDQTISMMGCNWTADKDDQGHGYIKSDLPAVLTLTGNAESAKKRGIVFTGAAALHYAGSGTFAFTNAVSTSTGPLKVSSGTVEFRAGAGWSSVSNVTVEGTGVLKISNGAGDIAFGVSAGKSGCWLELADDGKLEIAEGEQVTVRTLGLRGENGRLDYVSGGVYGGPDAGLDEAHTLSCLAGAGTIRVKRTGYPGSVILLQ